MIGEGIYSLINIPSINALVNDISPTVADTTKKPPYIVYNYETTPIVDKDGYNVFTSSIQVDIYTNKDRSGSNGVQLAEQISELVEGQFYMRREVIGTLDVRYSRLEDKQVMYDPVSQLTRIILNFNLRYYKG